MNTRIGDEPFIPPLSAKGDTVDKPDTEQRRERGHPEKRSVPEEAAADVMAFSIDAIRALLKQENVTDPAVFATLDALQAQNVQGIPIASGQGILAAIGDAAARHGIRLP